MNMTSHEKMLLDLIIRQVQESIADRKLKSRKALAKDIKRKLGAWIKGNDLRPELVQVIDVKKFERWAKQFKQKGS